MNGFFSYEGKFNKVVSDVIAILELNLLWLISSIPVITIGITTPALFYAIEKQIFQGDGYVWANYLKGLRENWKQGSLIGGIFLGILGVAAVNFKIMLTVYTNKEVGSKWSLLFLGSMVLCLLWFTVAASYASRFKNRTSQVCVNALTLISRHWGTDLAIGITLLAAVLGCWMFPVAILFAPAAACVLITYYLDRLYEKYLMK